MNFFENPNFGIDKDKETKDKKKKIAGIMAAGVILASAGEALANEKYVPDEKVVGQKEYVIPGVVDSNKVPGAIERGVVEGAIRNDGKIYQEEKTIRGSENEKKTDMSDMHRGGKIVIEGKEYGIEK